MLRLIAERTTGTDGRFPDILPGKDRSDNEVLNEGWGDNCTRATQYSILSVGIRAQESGQQRAHKM
jgi:hypothetical protein